MGIAHYCGTGKRWVTLRFTHPMSYNDLGQRVRKSQGEDAIHYLYDETGQLAGEYDEEGRVAQETVYLGGIPVAVLKKSKTYYLYTDHLNTPRAISTTKNKEVWRWDSDPFGVTRANTAATEGDDHDHDDHAKEDPDGDGKKFTYNLRFPGQYFDRETGLHYNYFRDYDPKSGRYIESDPIGLQGGLNTYVYVDGDPINASDIDGQRGMSLRNFVETIKRLLASKATPPSPKPDPKPVTPSSRYGDCTAAQHAILQATVNAACKTTPYSPSRADDCAALGRKLAQAEACIAARTAINNICYKGGDAGHREAIQNAEKSARNCREIMSSKGCGAVSSSGSSSQCS